MTSSLLTPVTRRFTRPAGPFAEDPWDWFWGRGLPERFGTDLGLGLYPPVDIYHDDDKLVLRVEVPGLSKDAIHISFEGTTLTISGEKIHPDGARYHRVESWCGTFSRSVEVPASVDGSKVEAEYKDGVLFLTLPFKETAKPHMIPIKG
jgi:HSP20 family protein